MKYLKYEYFGFQFVSRMHESRAAVLRLVKKDPSATHYLKAYQVNIEVYDKWYTQVQFVLFNTYFRFIFIVIF